MDKKANVPALILAVAVILMGVIVFTINNKNDTLQGFDASEIAKLEQEVVSGVDDAAIYTVMDVAYKGFSNQTDVWYCNSPYVPTEEQVKETINSVLKKQVESVIYALEGENVQISDPVVSLTVEESGTTTTAHIDMEDLIMGIRSLETNATRDLAHNLSVKSRAMFLYRQFLKWMECDAGSIGTKVEDLLTNKECSFEKCTCGFATYSDEELENITEEFGVDLDEIENEISLSLDSLRNLMTGAESCNAPAGKVENINCTYEITDSVIENEINQQTTDVCFMTGNSGTRTRGTSPDLGEWNSQSIKPDSCLPPDRVKIGGSPLDSPPFPPEKKDVVIDSEVFSLYSAADQKLIEGLVLALDKKAAVNYRITCRDGGIPEEGILPVEASVLLHFSVENECEYPDIYVPDDWEEAFEWKCGSAGGPNVCDVPGEICGQRVCYNETCQFDTDGILKCLPDSNTLNTGSCNPENGHPACLGTCTMSGCDVSASIGSSCTLGSCGIAGACDSAGRCDRSEYAKCCGGNKIPRNMGCCAGQAIDPGMGCCKGNTFNKSTEVCCGGTINSKDTCQTCCSGGYCSSGDCSFQGG